MNRDTFNGPLGISLVFIALALLVVAMYAPALVHAATSPTLRDDPRLAGINTAVKAHEDAHATSAARFNGRSFYFMPAPWPKKFVPPPPPPPNDNTPKPVAPIVSAPPPSYSGPTPNNILGDEVWFIGDKKRVRVGEEDFGVTVISVNPPWMVRLGYQGGEYDVPVFGYAADEALFSGNGYAGASSLPGLIEGEKSGRESADDGGSAARPSPTRGRPTPSSGRNTARPAAPSRAPNRGTPNRGD